MYSVGVKGFGMIIGIAMSMPTALTDLAWFLSGSAGLQRVFGN